MTPYEVPVMFPLVRAILDMYRSGNDERFEHLVKQIGMLFDSNNVRGNATLNLVFDAFSRIMGRPPIEHGRRRAEPVPIAPAAPSSPETATRRATPRVADKQRQKK